MALFGEGRPQVSNDFLLPFLPWSKDILKKPWIMPLYRVHNTATPASRNRVAYASPSSRSGSNSAVITRAGGNRLSPFYTFQVAMSNFSASFSFRQYFFKRGKGKTHRTDPHCGAITIAIVRLAAFAYLTIRCFVQYEKVCLFLL
jgi:hypothetical protein